MSARSLLALFTAVMWLGSGIATATQIAPGIATVMRGASLTGPYADESYDDGLPPVQAMRDTRLEGPTPSTVIGAKTLTTVQVRDLLLADPNSLSIDVSNTDNRASLPGAVWLRGAGSGGSFEDDVQARLKAKMAELTRGSNSTAIVVFCRDSSCWFACNAILRLMKLGYAPAWYRGGRVAWQAAKLPFVRARIETW